MKIGIVYNAPCNIMTILQNPDDDAAGAVCFLAMQLAKLGNEVTIFTQAPSADIFNVRIRHIEIKDRALVLDPALLEKDYTALIFKNCAPEFAVSIKGALPYPVAIYLWTSLQQNDARNQGLKNPEILAHFKKIVCVSDWQRFTFSDVFNLPRDKLRIINYALSPMFEDLFVDGKEFFNIKPKELRLAYTSQPDENDHGFFGTK